MNELTLGEEEVFDVSLATFYVFDRENTMPLPASSLSEAAVGGRRPRHAAAMAAAAVDAAAATQWVAAVASTHRWPRMSFRGCRGCRGCGCFGGCGGVAASGGGAAAAVYRGARASSARPHRLVALIYKGAESAVAWRIFLNEGPPTTGSALARLQRSSATYAGSSVSPRAHVASGLCDEAKSGQILISPRVLMKVQYVVKVEPVR